MSRAATATRMCAEQFICAERRRKAILGIASMAREIGLYIDEEAAKGHVAESELIGIRDGLAIIRKETERLSE